jgi:hypothetical protein
MRLPPLHQVHDRRANPTIARKRHLKVVDLCDFDVAVELEHEVGFAVGVEAALQGFGEVDEAVDGD